MGGVETARVGNPVSSGWSAGGSADVARPYVPRLASQWLASSPDQLHRRIDGSLVFADISGFTRLSERLAVQGRAGAEEIVGLVGEVLTALITEIEARGGDILVFAGDALVALFEEPDASVRAARTAAAIRHWFASRGSIATSVGPVALRVSAGVASGPVDLILAGDDPRAIFVAGPTTSAMVRLERAAAAGEILVDDRTAASLDRRWLGTARDGGTLLRRTMPLEETPRHAEPTPGIDLTPLIPMALRSFLLGGVVLESEHRLATIAFLLTGGLDRRLSTEPASVAADLDALFRRAATSAARHDVTLLGTDVTADGVTLFLAAGAPAATAEDEERMLRVLGEVLEAPEARRLEARAGVNRGAVFAGDVGAPGRRTYTAMGDTTNLAARLAARATRGELLATADVLARSAVEFESEALPSFRPKGKREAVIPFRVGRRVGRHGRTPARLPLAGRDAELAVLAEAFNRAVIGSGGAVTVIGDAGTGKSRLIQELLLDERIAGRLVSRFTPADESTPYGGLREPLRELAGIAETLEPSEAGERLMDWIGEVAPVQRQWAPLLAIPFGASIPETDEVEGLAPAFRRRQLQSSMAELLGATLAAPAVLVLEDFHWADEASSALLESLMDGLAARSWLLVALQRPGRAEFGGDRATRIDLEALPSSAVMELALSASGTAALSDAALAAIVERAGGNPLFVRELAAAAAERGGVDALPDRLETLLASRIDRLDARGRALLRRAAVLGRTVDIALLGEMLADGDEDVSDLATWSRLDEFVGWVDPARIRFRHDLIRDAAYEGLSHARRRHLHARLAAAIERRAGEDATDVAGLLAVHYGLGGLPEPAFRYGRIAGDLARSRYANVDAAALYRRAIEAAGRIDSIPTREVADVAESLGDVAELAGQYDDALNAYSRARSLVRQTAAGAGGSESLARVERKTGIVCERAGRYRQALTWYGRGRRHLEGVADRPAESLRIRLDLDRAGIRFRQGHYADCVRMALQAAASAERIGDRALEAHSYYLLHAAYGDLGSPEVVRYRDLALPIYEELGDLVGQGNVLNNLGIEAYFEGRWDDALDLYARSKVAKTRAGDVANAATQSNNEAEILSDQGRFAEAESLLRDALRIWRAAGYEIGIALATSNLGRVAARAGRYDEGLAILGDAVARFQRMGADGYVDETRARVAECLVLAERAADARAVAEETLVHVRREAEASVLEVQLERTLAWCARLEGDFDRARAHVETSLRVGRAMKAEFEIALTLRALAAASAVADERHDALVESDGILASLGVVAVAEPVVLAGGDAVSG